MAINIQADIFDNPITRRESVSLLRGRSKWFWILAYGFSAFVLAAPLIWNMGHAQSGTNVFPSLNSWVAVGLFVNVALYVMVVLRTITVANDTVIRERRGKTWDLLMLTGVSTWRVVLGKWLGTMGFMVRDYVWLYIMRVGLVYWFIVLQEFRELDRYWDYRHGYTLADVSPDLSLLIPAALIMAAFVLLEMLMSSAIGIATAMFSWSHRAGVWVALAVRIGTAGLLFFGLLWMTGIIRPYPYTVQYNDYDELFIWTVGASLIENGAITSAALASEDAHTPPVALAKGQLVAIVPYLLLTLSALFTARTVAVWNGVNPPGAAQKVKPKRRTAIEADDKTVTPVTADATTPDTTVKITDVPGTQNALNLAQPEAYRVEFFRYQRNVSRLYVRVSNGRDVFYVQFANVAYLDAPSQWAGADLRIGTLDERDALLQENAITPNTLVADGLRLYVFNSNAGKPVRIIAGHAVLKDDVVSDV